jgi:hypothetical protein
VLTGVRLRPRALALRSEEALDACWYHPGNAPADKRQAMFQASGPSPACSGRLRESSGQGVQQAARGGPLRAPAASTRSAGATTMPGAQAGERQAGRLIHGPGLPGSSSLGLPDARIGPTGWQAKHVLREFGSRGRAICPRETARDVHPVAADLALVVASRRPADRVKLVDGSGGGAGPEECWRRLRHRAVRRSSVPAAHRRAADRPSTNEPSNPSRRGGRRETQRKEGGMSWTAGAIARR